MSHAYFIVFKILSESPNALLIVTDITYFNIFNFEQRAKGLAESYNSLIIIPQLFLLLYPRLNFIY